MQGVLIGEVLCEMGILTRHHVERIVTHQRITRQKFGQIAVRWGLATQEQVWEAWARQFAQREHLDLSTVGTDTAAWQCLSLEMACAYGVVPLRLWGDHLVLAAPVDLGTRILARLAESTGCRIHVCPTEKGAIRIHLDAMIGVTA